MTRLTLSMALAVAAAVAGPAGLAGCEKKAPESAQEQARSVSVVAVAPREIEGGLTASGGLLPREEVAIFPQINGYRVVSVSADEGSTVRAGQVLATMDDTLLKAQVAQQSALLEEQKVAAKRADAEAARVKGMDASGILAKEQIETRRFSADSAHAAVGAAEAALNDVNTRHALLTVRAPVDGLVIERAVRPGDMSATATPWFRMAKDSQIELAADVGEDALDKIRTGDPAQVTLADGSRVQGRVRLVSPRVDAGTKLGKVKISLPVAANIRAGGFASAAFLGASRSALAVPETAVRYDANGAAVMVVGPDNKVSRVPVSTGQRGGGYVELLTGPPAGSRVVERAGAMLVPGDVIRPVGPS